MNYGALNKMGIDTKQALSRFCDNAPMYEKYLMKLTEDQTFAALQQAMQENEYEEAFRLAHTLKSILGNLSINHLLERFTELSDCLRGGMDMERAQELTALLKSEYSLCIEKIKEAHHE